MHADRTALQPVPAIRTCPACPWELVSDSAALAEMELATHRIAEHATLPERVQVQRLVESYRQILGPLPETLLVLAVQQVLNTPTSPALTTTEGQVRAA